MPQRRCFVCPETQHQLGLRLLAANNPKTTHLEGRHIQGKQLTRIFWQSHAGLFNLCIVVLVAVNSRLIIENMMKLFVLLLTESKLLLQYGVLINSNFWFSSRSLRDWPLLMCCLTLPLFPLAAYLVEKLAWKKRLSDPVVISLHLIITTAAILYPVFMILRFDSVVLSGVTLMLCACINWLKLVSFVHTNYDMRSLVNSTNKGEAESTSLELFYDVDFQSLVYFMVAPTLCYQIYLDPKARNDTEYKLETFSGVYRKLSGKDVVFEYPMTEA
ncbi:type 1 diaclyglycerol acyltransferase [Artemisia annua]|uniref:diacylglycerol O-acyltransferase n=1 Tax=Artemisia annua TaxID=35608 RepID=A0A2U1LIL6_ARTAN|nr:type 1 diaclyglycerol acyltransferase [Artemisia annua]